MLKLLTREQCEQFQMMRFGISCATCERTDEECPWHRQDEPTDLAALPRRSSWETSAVDSSDSRPVRHA